MLVAPGASGKARDLGTGIGLAVLHACAILGLVPRLFSWSAVAVAAILYVITGLGISLGYHRHLSHRSLALARPVSLAFVFFGSLALEGGPLAWAATHRAHHAHADGDGDPHGAQRGLAWSHVRWLYEPNPDRVTRDEYERLIPDLARDSALRTIERWSPLAHLVLALGLFAAGGLSWLVWGVFVRIALVHHVTWLVNSLLHDVGAKRFATGDRARNNAWLAPFSFGEAWHNNHHAFPGSARIGLAWYEFDPTWYVIRILARVGLARDVRVPSAESLVRRAL